MSYGLIVFRPDIAPTTRSEFRNCFKFSSLSRIHLKYAIGLSAVVIQYKKQINKIYIRQKISRTSVQ